MRRRHTTKPQILILLRTHCLQQPFFFATHQPRTGPPHNVRYVPTQTYIQLSDPRSHEQDPNMYHRQIPTLIETRLRRRKTSLQITASTEASAFQSADKDQGRLANFIPRKEKQNVPTIVASVVKELRRCNVISTNTEAPRSDSSAKPMNSVCFFAIYFT